VETHYLRICCDSYFPAPSVAATVWINVSDYGQIAAHGSTRLGFKSSVALLVGARLLSNRLRTFRSRSQTHSHIFGIYDRVLGIFALTVSPYRFSHMRSRPGPPVLNSFGDSLKIRKPPPFSLFEAQS
jgi:hypothetical protein